MREERDWNAFFKYAHQIYGLRRNKERFSVVEGLKAQDFAEKFSDL